MTPRDVWILAESRGGKVAPVSFELIAWARSLGDAGRVRITALLAGLADDPGELCFRGADEVIHADSPALAGWDARALALWMGALFRSGRRPSVLLAAATATGRTVLPYLAAREGLGLTADCTGLAFDPETGALLQTRPAAGGNIMATIRTVRGTPTMATVRPHSRQPLARDSGRLVKVGCFAAEPAGAAEGGSIELLGEKPFEHSHGIADARIVISGGKGFKRKEAFRALDRLADLMGAEVGASREAVDRGWAEYPRQVGLSGRTISPDLYIAVGISGAIQHLAGMMTSGRIVSVNSDPDAPIAAMSDLAIRADLNEFLPALAARLEGRH